MRHLIFRGVLVGLLSLMMVPAADVSGLRLNDKDQISAVRFTISGGRRGNRGHHRYNRHHRYPRHHYYRYGYYRPHYVYRDQRDYVVYDSNYVLVGSSTILSVQQMDGKTRIGLSNGMDFDVEGVELPFGVDDYANVYRKRTRDEGTLYELHIQSYKFPARRLN